MPVGLGLYGMERNLQHPQTDVDLVAHVKQREVEDETWGKQEMRYMGGVSREGQRFDCNNLVLWVVHAVGDPS